MKVSRNDIINLAKSSYNHTGNVDVVSLASQLGIEVYAVEESDDFVAQIKYSKKNDQFYILVNKNHPHTRQRFSIAHELAHYVRDHDKIKAKGAMNRQNGGDANEEHQADKLAAEILMPDEIVRDYMNQMDVDSTQVIKHGLIAKLSEKFKVSKLVATLRLRHLKYYVPYIEFA